MNRCKDKYMQKNIQLFTSLFVLFITLFTFHSNAAEFEEGVHYQELKPYGVKKPEVREFFSFYCPHCFKQESFMREIKSTLPAGTKFINNHVENMPGQNVEVEKYLSKALIVAERLKLKARFTDSVFNLIHVKKQKLSSIRQVNSIFNRLGVETKKVSKLINSFVIKGEYASRSKKTQFIRQQGINSVPTLIINGRYQTLSTGFKSKKEYFALIQYLLNKPL